MRAVIALGGNAFLNPYEEYNFENHLKNIVKVSKHIARISEKAEICITHGNGPQVGEFALKEPEFPLDIHVSETQGMLGYLLQREISKNSKMPVVTIITQVVVDKKDPAFKNPTKPIGPYYKSKPKFKNFIKTPFGYRKVVPSPEPRSIVEEKIIKGLFGKVILITCGGGGIPVIRKGKKLIGVEAVIDKDLTSQTLANILNADMLLILTNVNYAYLNFGKKNQMEIKNIDVKKLKELYERGEFAKGSMAPKILACIRFIENGGKKAVIAHLDEFEKAFQGKTGTIIEKHVFKKYKIF